MERLNWLVSRGFSLAAAKPWLVLIAPSMVLVLAAANACSGSKMSGQTPTVTNPPVPQVTANTTPQAVAPASPAPAVQGPAAPVVNNSAANTPSTDHSNAGATPAPPAPLVGGFTSCSTVYRVPATANPYLAGSPAQTTVTYAIQPADGTNAVDNGRDQAPVLVNPTANNCLVPGQALYFSVSGQISHGGNDVTDGNGDLSQVVQHQKGAILGKSNIAAPINSMVGVFLSAADPASATVPDGYDFTSQAARSYTTMSPAIGQIFFIGNGLTPSGTPHQVIVPQGATRLYFGIMDSYQWNNNTGTLSGSIMIKK